MGKLRNDLQDFVKNSIDRYNTCDWETLIYDWLLDSYAIRKMKLDIMNTKKGEEMTGELLIFKDSISFVCDSIRDFIFKREFISVPDYLIIEKLKAYAEDNALKVKIDNSEDIELILVRKNIFDKYEDLDLKIQGGK